MYNLIEQLFIQYPGIFKGYYSKEDIKYGVEINVNINAVDNIALLIEKLLQCLFRVIKDDIYNLPIIADSNSYNIPFLIKAKDTVTQEYVQFVFTISSLSLLEKNLPFCPLATSQLPNFYLTEEGGCTTFSIGNGKVFLRV